MFISYTISKNEDNNLASSGSGRLESKNSESSVLTPEEVIASFKNSQKFTLQIFKGLLKKDPVKTANFVTLISTKNFEKKLSRWSKKYFSQLLDPSMQPTAAAVSQYSPREIAVLGVCCLIFEIHDKAIFYLRLAVSKEDELGIFYLARCYRRGLGIEVNYAAARQLFENLSQRERAQHLGFRDSINNLALLLEDKFPAEANTAAAYYIESAALDSPHGTYHLALCYRNGLLGLEQNPEQAKALFVKAALTGSLGGLLNYRIDQSDNDQLKCLRVAAEYTDEFARNKFITRVQEEKMLSPELTYHAMFALGYKHAAVKLKIAFRDLFIYQRKNCLQKNRCKICIESNRIDRSFFLRHMNVPCQVKSVISKPCESRTGCKS